MGRAPPVYLVPLRVRSVRGEAGVGVPVRSADAGAHRRHVGVLSEGRLACALRLPRRGGDRDPGRDAMGAVGDARGGADHPRFPRRRHGHGDLQDQHGLVDLSGGELAADRGRAVVHRLHVCSGRLVHGALLAAIRLPVHAPSAIVGAGRLVGGDLHQFLHAPFHVGHQTGADPGRRAAAGAGRDPLQDLAGAPEDAVAARRRADRRVHLARGEHRHVHQCVDLSASAGRLDAGVACQAECVVPADDPQLHHGGGAEWCGTVGACRKPRAEVRSELPLYRFRFCPLDSARSRTHPVGLRSGAWLIQPRAALREAFRARRRRPCLHTRTHRRRRLSRPPPARGGGQRG